MNHTTSTTRKASSNARKGAMAAACATVPERFPLQPASAFTAG